MCFLRLMCKPGDEILSDIIDELGDEAIISINNSDLFSNMTPLYSKCIRYYEWLLQSLSKSLESKVDRIYITSKTSAGTNSMNRGVKGTPHVDVMVDYVTQISLSIQVVLRLIHIHQVLLNSNNLQDIFAPGKETADAIVSWFPLPPHSLSAKEYNPELLKSSLRHYSSVFLESTISKVTRNKSQNFLHLLIEEYVSLCQSTPDINMGLDYGDGKTQLESLFGRAKDMRNYTIQYKLLMHFLKRKDAALVSLLAIADHENIRRLYGISPADNILSSTLWNVFDVFLSEELHAENNLRDSCEILHQV